MTLQVQVSGAPSPMTDAEKSDVLTTLGAVSTAALTAHAGSPGNPHNVTKAQVGLGNVDNTGDADKPVSAAQALAIESAVSAHEAAADPHPGYLTPAEADAAYAPIGASGVTNLSATASPTGVTVASDTGADATLPAADATNAGLMLPAQVTKLSGIADGATANATDAQLRDRATHTGTQATSTITGLDAALAGKADLVGGKLSASQVPDIALVQYLGAVASQAAMLALTGQAGDWCTRTDTGTTFIVTGSPSLIGGWTQLSYPAAPVTSVAGRTGAVTIAAADVSDSGAAGRDLLRMATLSEIQASVSGGTVKSLPLYWDQQQTPLVLNHRGGMAIAPQNTIEAFDQSISFGNKLIEMDVRKTADGVLVVFHDATVDGLTDGTGSIESKTWEQVQALNIDIAPLLMGPAWPATSKIAKFDEVLNRYKSLALFAIEDKGAPSNMAAILAEIAACGVPPRQCLMQQGMGGIAGLTTAASAGYPCLMLSTSGADIAAPTLAAAGIKYVGGDYAQFTQAKYDEMTAAGITVLVYTVSRRYQLENVLARGGSGVFSDDAGYSSGKVAATTLSQFHLQKYVTGMVGAFDENTDSIDPTYRGRFTAPNYWGYSETATGYRGCLFGNLSPVANPSAVTMFFRLTFDAVTDSSRWASIFIGEKDVPFLDNNTGTAQGNHILIRQNGVLAVYTKAAGEGATAVGWGPSQVYALGTEYFFKVTVGATTITVANTDSTGAVLYSYTATTSLFRGGYLTFGRSNAAVRYRQIRVLSS